MKNFPHFCFFTKLEIIEKIYSIRSNCLTMVDFADVPIGIKLVWSYFLKEYITFLLWLIFLPS